MLQGKVSGTAVRGQQQRREARMAASSSAQATKPACKPVMNGYQAPAPVRSQCRRAQLKPVCSAVQEKIYLNLDETTKKVGKPRLVVLGSGWGAVSFIKSLPYNISEKYELIVVSPRNYFLYTPLLPAVATGTVEERSIVESIRTMVVGKGEYYEALCKDVDPVKKELVCCFPADAGLDVACFKLSYDVLVMSVGSINNTFGIKGVDKHCMFFKSIDDANKLRQRVSECFERAALPQTPEEERKRLLSFVVCGGGPTGVEVAAELYDMIHDDLRKLYPNLIKDVEIRIIELMDHVLSTYDRAISVYTGEQFKRAGVKLVLNSRVASVGDGVVNVVDKQNNPTEIKFGACVWATGVAMNPLVKELQGKVKNQTHFRSILTDEFLCVKGLEDGSIYAIGDAATIDQPKALDYAEQLFAQADVNKDNVLTITELRDMMAEASKQFSHLAEHARFLDAKTGGPARFGNMVNDLLKGDAPGTSETKGPLGELNDSTQLTSEQFKEVLKKIDSGLRGLPATAQVARQQGQYLAELFADNKITGDKETTVLHDHYEAFKYAHKGSAAYIGADNAVFDVPKVGNLMGFHAGLLWKSFETYSQFSFRNQCLVASDWVRTKIFGRDISRV